MTQDELFIKCLKDALRNTTKLKLADSLCVSIPTLNRWLRGQNLPYPVIRDKLMLTL